MPHATFKAVVRSGGSMVAAIAAVVGGKARLFILQPKEKDDLFIGRVSSWIRSQGAEALEMQPPEVLPDGIEAGAVVMQLRHALGIDRRQDEAAEYDVKCARLVWPGNGQGEQEQ